MTIIYYTCIYVFYVSKCVSSWCSVGLCVCVCIFFHKILSIYTIHTYNIIINIVA